jgi:hypothetical protein
MKVIAWLTKPIVVIMKGVGIGVVGIKIVNIVQLLFFELRNTIKFYMSRLIPFQSNQRNFINKRPIQMKHLRNI